VNNYFRAPCALLLACGVLAGLPLASGGRPALAADAETANACVGFQNEEGEKVLIVHASNDCERRLTCSLTYELSCEDNEQNVTSRVQRQTPFNLASKGKTDLTLGAAACKQGWRISDLAWTCR
jgi:hypothetical protein